MDKSESTVFHPVGVFKESLSVWSRNLIFVVALNCVNIFLVRILQLSKAMSGSMQASWINTGLSILYGLEYVAVLILTSFVSLIILQYLKPSGGGRVSFADAFDEARRGIIPYLKAFFLLLVFFVGVSLVAFIILVAGDTFYGRHGLRGFNMAALLTTSTVFVVLVIAACWYTFFYSLSPLVGAYEKKDTLACLRSSRLRVRGNALRYAAALFLCLIFYVVTGLILYFIVSHLTARRLVLNMIDPVMATLFGPLWLAVWKTSYERLTALKIAS